MPHTSGQASVSGVIRYRATSGEIMIDSVLLKDVRERQLCQKIFSKRFEPYAQPIARH
jgi:hypothetical protein